MNSEYLLLTVLDQCLCLTDKAVLFFFVYVVPKHVPAADSYLQILIFFGVRLCIAEDVGIKYVDMKCVAASLAEGHKQTVHCLKTVLSLDCRSAQKKVAQVFWT